MIYGPYDFNLGSSRVHNALRCLTHRKRPTSSNLSLAFFSPQLGLSLVYLLFLLWLFNYLISPAYIGPNSYHLIVLHQTNYIYGRYLNRLSTPYQVADLNRPVFLAHCVVDLK